MKFKVAVSIATLVLTTACATGTSTDGGDEMPVVRITADSISGLVNKRLFFIDGDGNEQRNNYFVLRDGGSADGTWNNEPLVATWEMRDDYWCRILIEFHNADSVGAEDCQLWEQQSDNVIRVTRDRGAGNSWLQGIGEEDIQQ